MIKDFLRTLSKFYRDELNNTLQDIFFELIKIRNFDNIENEIVFLEIFNCCSIMSHNSLVGCTSASVRPEFIKEIYVKIIKSFLNLFYQNVDITQPNDILDKSLFIIVYYMKFVTSFSYYLHYE